MSETVFVPVLGNIEVSFDNVAINDFNDFTDVIIDDEDKVVKIKAYNAGFNVSHREKGRHGTFVDDGAFKFDDYPEVDKLVECALNGYL